MKLHLGCGPKLWPGFINIDVAPGADLVCDITKLPYEDNSADEIHAIHVIEHLHPYDLPNVLDKWVSILKPKGLLCLELPDLSKILNNFAKGHDDLYTRAGLFGALGDTHHPREMQHQWAWYSDDIVAMLRRCKEVRVEAPLFHKPVRDMRIVGVK